MFDSSRGAQCVNIPPLDGSMVVVVMRATSCCECSCLLTYFSS